MIPKEEVAIFFFFDSVKINGSIKGWGQLLSDLLAIASIY